MSCDAGEYNSQQTKNFKYFFCKFLSDKTIQIPPALEICLFMWDLQVNEMPPFFIWNYKFYIHTNKKGVEMQQSDVQKIFKIPR